MFVYANEMTMKELKREFQYAFAEHKYPGVPDMHTVIIHETPFIIGDIPVIPVIVWHLNMKVYGYRFGAFTYITDANRIEDMEKKKIIDSNTIVLNALRKEPHISHFTLNEAKDMVQELKIPNAYFTHISHQLGRHADVEKHLPQGMHLAYDNLTLHFK
jgi:phosphoribosyl 1,2-cyclic phosphate phosphodiesterase